MNSYSDFLNVVSNLRPGTIFAATYDWCIQKGLKLLPATAKSWGRKFAVDYANYNCTKLSTGTDNHNIYEKN